jgi:DNA-dependent RNA polymerase auxiliary subunit epsilon
MPPQYPYTIEHHNKYLSMLNCNALEFDKQTAEFISKRQLLGEKWTTDDNIEFISLVSNSLLQETSLHPPDSNNKNLSRK